MPKHELSYVLVYDIFFIKFPENPKRGLAKVIQQKVSSATRDDTIETRMQAYKQACGYLFRSRIRDISFDDPDFNPETDVKFLRAELRIDGKTPAAISKRQQSRRRTKTVTIPPKPEKQKPTPKPTAGKQKSAQASFAF